MCRNIKPLFNFELLVNDKEDRAAAFQYERTISGFNKPCKANEVGRYAGVNEIAAVSSQNREGEVARARATRRFAS